MSILDIIVLSVIIFITVIGIDMLNKYHGHVDEEPKSHLFKLTPQLQCAVFTYNGQLSNPACKWLFGSATFKEYEDG